MRECTQKFTSHIHFAHLDLREEVEAPVRNARVIFRCLIATSTLKGSFCRLQHIHVHVKEEEWEVIYRPFIDLSLLCDLLLCYHLRGIAAVSGLSHLI